MVVNVHYYVNIRFNFFISHKVSDEKSPKGQGNVELFTVLLKLLMVN